MKANISLDGNATEEPCKVYNISITDSPTSLGSDEWLRMIKSDRDRIIKERLISAEAVERYEVWKENHALDPYSETEMVHHGLKQNGAVVCALDQPGMTQTPLNQLPPSEAIFTNG